MKLTPSIAFLLVSSSFVVAQTNPARLAPGTTLPIRFDRSVDPAHVHAGDPIAAKTIQQVRLADGQILSAGTRVAGHVVEAKPFSFDNTPYAKQAASTLTIHFDSVISKSGPVPLNVYVRAMADPITVWDAERPRATDLDPLSTTTQIGGDLVTPSQAEVQSQDGDTVGYKRRSGIYAHLVSAVGRGTGSCDASDTEQSMGRFSAAACGLYGYTDVALVNSDSTVANVSNLTLTSRRHSVKIWAKSEALLEVVASGSGAIAQ
jgi:hypothetical protein